MIFNSLHFAVFLPVVLVLAYVLRARITPRNVMLLAASYYFYGVWDVRFLGLLVATTFVDWLVGKGLGAKPGPGEATPEALRKRKLLITISCVVNLTVLGFFKYYGFFAQSFADLLTGMGLHASLPVLKIVLPVGISFYTFQSMSYTIDVYRGTMPPERKFLHFALYVAFFPQLVAGPIERADLLLKQISLPRPMNSANLAYGAYLFGLGLFKKVVIADNVALVADKAYAVDHPSALVTLLGTYAFAVQIYCDFAGYTDCARGVSRMMGFGLMQNFDQPYFATNPSDFWRRWHISLSTWLRDYLYIPLGGNRGSTARVYCNLMATMVLGGLWHGAAWNFVLWGLFHGGLLCAHRALGRPLEKLAGFFGGKDAKLWWLVRVVVFFHVTCVGWLLFRAHSFAQIKTMFASFVKGPFKGLATLTETDLLVLAACAGTLFIIEVIIWRAKDEAVALRWPIWLRACVYFLAILAFVLFGNYEGVQFIYFQF